MKIVDEDRPPREYPHLVTRGFRRMIRWTISVSNRPSPPGRIPAPNTFAGRGMLNVAGELTANGRRIILDEYVGRNRSKPGRDCCIVWGPADCTWIDRSGAVRDERHPPQADDTHDTQLYTRMPIITEDCWTIELPKGHEPSHLCILKIDANRVEVAPGEPIVLGDLSDPPKSGLPDPAEGMIGADGRLVPPATWRGQPVAGVEDDWLVVGPVQPSDDGVILRQPWPGELRAACEKIAGMKLSDEVIDQAWRAARPDHLDFHPVGILRAA